MMKSMLVVILTAVALCLVSNDASAAAYIKIGDIKGESMRAGSGHDKWIDIESYQFSNGVLVIKHKNGKKVRLKEGMYRFKDGKQYLVKAGKAKLVAKGKRSIIRAKTKSVTVNKPGVERENIGVKQKKGQDDNE
ncbi:hypothetical protein FLL45_09340 [Aliikangiella marina]|uniref:FecR protein domain-containing protein n=1 Tax=Aliikangiella marina TaxID=1712262 RepID=A0A545TD69_9GAMM|nr:hypothetical protein [Aliikangiella marina]TQV75131.1 hypothetical protein FLL45_09340 [Aliikangiella marina]